MSSDGYFDDDPLDVAALDQIDAIAAAHFESPNSKGTSSVLLPPRPDSPPIVISDKSEFDATFEVDDNVLATLDHFIEDALKGNAQPVPGPSNPTTGPKGGRQMTLFGDVFQDDGASSSKTAGKARQPRNGPGHPPRQTKTWDHSAFAKTGWRKPKAAKEKSNDRADEEDEEELEFEQFPAPVAFGEWVPSAIYNVRSRCAVISRVCAQAHKFTRFLTICRCAFPDR
jgi:ATP-dependent DNA helicase MPH1